MAYTSAYTDHYQDLDASGESYDRSIANRFELAIFRLERVVLRDLFQRLRGADPNTAYLDFACGTGRILDVFKDLIRTKVGVDTSAGQLAAARNKVPDAKLVHGNLVENPELLGGRKFGLITSFRLLLNLEPENRVPILRALRQQLTPDGYLIVDNHMNRYSILGITALFAHKVLGVPRKPNVPPGRRGIISTMTESEMRSALAAAGLRVEEVHRIFVLPGHKRLQLLPTRGLVSVEAFLSRMPLVNRLSKNQVYVCRQVQPNPS
ncbi:MAG: methyltransferase domain-containing protein [Gemmatimonadales bacterium]|nr:methyltransferase domain-containing protein [Gemmatimonadota bacterium]